MSRKLKLSDGNEIPFLGLGTWASKPGEVGSAVKYAIKNVGYRHIDCALIYQNEEEIGKALKELFDEGVVKREDIFITSKIWNAYHSKEKAIECCKLSLNKLGLEYLDLLLIHWPIAYVEDQGLFPKYENGDFMIDDNIDYLQAWQGLEECHNLGLVKSIGLSNFNSEQVKRVLDNCKIKPVMLQVECHAYLNQQQLKNFCDENDITMTAYSPLGSPNRFFKADDEPSLFKEEKIINLAKKYNKTPAQIMIRFNIERSVVVIPKSVTNQRIAENANIYDFKISQEEIDDLLTLKQHRFICPEWFKKSKYFPFNIEY